tara:strand:- start:223 stop:453 length:231 start_codon:yes stop_codon:yes gene_type:complete
MAWCKTEHSLQIKIPVQIIALDVFLFLQSMQYLLNEFNFNYFSRKVLSAGSYCQTVGLKYLIFFSDSGWTWMILSY